MTCDRCGRETTAWTGSYFDTSTICLTHCAPAERAHPLYEEARRVETEAVKQGDLNYPGIGLPDDLRAKS